MTLTFKSLSCLMICAALAGSLAGCSGVGKSASSTGIPKSIAAYAQAPEPGSIEQLPSAPVLSPPSATSSVNLLENPGFELGTLDWDTELAGSEQISKTGILRAEGMYSLLLTLDGAQNTTLSQTITLEPGTPYWFSGYTFIKDAGKSVLEVTDPKTGVTLTSEQLSGPMSSWQPLSLVFVTGATTAEVSVGIKASGKSGSAILLDGCALHALAATNLDPQGSMEVPPEEGQMARHYWQGASAEPVEGGYESEHALALPMLESKASSLFCLLPPESGALWISAMVRSTAGPGGEAPDVSVTFEQGPDETRAALMSADVPGTGEWQEAGFAVEVPAAPEGEESEAPPFHVLRFERPAGVDGEVLIDEIVMFKLPEGHFAGGFAAVSPKP